MHRTHDFSHPVDTTPPKVCAIIVYHRDPQDQRLLDALESLAVQSYPHLECITWDNRPSDHGNTFSIGMAYNEAIKQTDAELITFLGEQDMLVGDTIAGMVAMHTAAKQNIEGMVHTSAGTTLLLDGGQRSLHHMRSPGLYERAFLLANPFADTDRNVHGIMQERMEALGRMRGTPVTWQTTHHFGYLLRMEPFRRDGIELR